MFWMALFSDPFTFVTYANLHIKITNYLKYQCNKNSLFVRHLGFWYSYHASLSISSLLCCLSLGLCFFSYDLCFTHLCVVVHLHYWPLPSFIFSSMQALEHVVRRPPIHRRRYRVHWIKLTMSSLSVY